MMRWLLWVYIFPCINFSSFQFQHEQIFLLLYSWKVENSENFPMNNLVFFCSEESKVEIMETFKFWGEWFCFYYSHSHPPKVPHRCSSATIFFVVVPLLCLAWKMIKQQFLMNIKNELLLTTKCFPFASCRCRRMIEELDDGNEMKNVKRVANSHLRCGVCTYVKCDTISALRFSFLSRLKVEETWKLDDSERCEHKQRRRKKMNKI